MCTYQMVWCANIHFAKNPNEEGKFRLGILRDPESRGGSVSAFDEIKDGMQIQVSEPKIYFHF